ncbi:helix-turn-helix domain-containing protein [Mailhella sp.]|uniref:helix-turn-helix domain-containing protein n=1 Tax=Mailhella sp. TaxID=1981029 RepID=UPI004062F574
MGNDVQERILRRARLLDLAKKIGNISEACRIVGVSRATFYYYQRLKAADGEEALFTNRHRKPNLKNRVPEEVERSVVAYAFENPSHGQQRASEELSRRGVFVSPTGIRSIWKRHELENIRKRYSALKKRQRGASVSRASLTIFASD